MGAVLSFFRPAPVARGDWSQQELAEFYRVEAALTQSGLRVTSDRGVSDENDPWFVFCRFDGEVILHFARIDGQYVVASEAFEHALKGPDFRTLLNAVAAEHPTLVPLPRPDANGRRGNLVMHPAALLAAIVASVAFQLAGGDAVAGELASDAPTVPMLNAADSAGTNGLPGISADAGMDRDDGPRADRGEEDRYAQKQVLVLSVLALISTTLPTDEEAAPVDRVFAEHQFVLHRDQSVSIPVAPNAAAVDEGRARPQPHDAATAEPSVAQTTSGYLVFSPSGQLQARTAQTPSGMSGFDFGSAGNHDHLEFHLPDVAIPVAGPQSLYAAARLFSIAAAAEKMASEAQATSVPRNPTSAPASEHALEPAGAETASAGRKMSVEAAVETESKGFALHIQGAVGSGIQGAVGSGGLLASAAGTQALNTQTANVQATAATLVEKAAGLAAAWSSPTASQSAGTGSASSNASIRTALSAFIEQHAGSSDANGLINLAAVDLSAKVKIADMSLISSLKGIGGKLATDILSGISDGTSGTTKAASSASTVEAGLSKVGLTDKADGASPTLPSLATGNLGGAAFSKSKAPAVSASTDSPVAAETPGGATLDTGALSVSVVVTKPKALDDAGRELITRFREATANVQTFVTDHSFVMIDMDAANYTNKDFSIRTWSIGPNQEITIVGIAPELHHSI